MGRCWHNARAFPKPQESRASSAGNSETLSRGGGPARRPAPSLPVEEPPAPAAESARSETRTLSFFPSRAKLRDS